MRQRKLVPVAAGLALLLAVAACSSDSTTDDTAAPAPQASGEALNLKGSCPDTVVIQTDWFPESEYGFLYQMLGPGYTIDKAKKRLSGPLVASGQDTGVRVEIRTGGPAIGFQQVSAQMYADKSITLGQVSTDEAIQNSAKQPTLAVLSPLEISPIMIMWNKDKHPDFNTIADIGQTDTKNELRGKKYPNVELQLINDTGYPMYGQALTIRPADKDKLAPCLEKLVPIIQQSTVDFITDPKATNELVIKAVTEFKDFWQYSPGMADYAVKTLKDLGLIGNGPNKTIGDMQAERVKRMVDILTPIFAAQRKPVKSELRAEDLFTNDYINPNIGLQAK
jgi:hypothetical protein